MQSSLYFDIDSTKKLYSDLIFRVQSHAEAHNMDVFMLNIPKSDLNDSSYKHDGCFMIMSCGYKIALINAEASDEEFDDYCEDINEIMNYLYQKYEYRGELGRFSSWAKPLIVDCLTIHDLDDLNDFWSQLETKNALEKKYTELLVTLCTGSINDINRVKAGVPITILDQVKQKIQAFDAEQTKFIFEGETDNTNKIIKIQGLSGTGKTEMLLHKLKELYQKPENYKIFVTCHNKILADSLKSRIPEFFNFMKVTKQIEWDERLWCTNAWGGQSQPHSGLYRYLCNFYNLPFLSYANFPSFNAVCAIAVKALKSKYPDGNIPPAMDYIIVDECQDFKDAFFELCQLVTSKKVYIAGDVFQSIFAEHSGKDYNADYFLKKCYRTDPKTLMFAHGLGLGLFEKKRLRWLSKEDWEACGYQYYEDQAHDNIVLEREPVRRFLNIGEDYESISLVGFIDEGLFPCLGDQIQKIIDEYPTSKVDDFCVIFLDNSQDVYSLASQLESYVSSRFGWAVNKAYENKKKIDGTLLVSNRNNVKGLEYPFVLCITKQLSSDYIYRNAIYTMLTRSFLKTILFLPRKGSGISQGILDGYKEIMSARKMTIAIPSEEEKIQIETRFSAAKNRRPIIEIIQEEIATLSLSAEDAERLRKVAENYKWEGIPEEEIRNRVRSLKEYL